MIILKFSENRHLRYQEGWSLLDRNGRFRLLVYLPLYDRQTLSTDYNLSH